MTTHLRHLFLPLIFRAIAQSCLAQERQADGLLFQITGQKETDPHWVKIQVA